MSALNQQLLFFLSALGAFNGVLLSFYLAYSKRQQTSYLLLAGLLFVISVRVGKSVLFYFSPELNKTILQIGLSACFLIGPLTYFFTMTHSHKFSKHHRVHLATLLVIPVVFGIAFPYQTNTELWGNIVYQLVNWTWLGYLVASGWLFYQLYSHNKTILVANNKQSLMLISVNLGVLLIWLAYFTSSYTSYILGALSFSFILYMTIVVFLRLDKEPKADKYQDKKIDAATAQTLESKLNDLMSEQQIYCQPDITLAKLAKKIGVSSALLSQLLNDNINKSFNNYINELRIEKAKNMLRSNNNLNMELVADSCGYNSMSTFYSAFKKQEATTPAKYRQAHFSNS
jgi:AraC-like DNA-binding protein